MEQQRMEQQRSVAVEGICTISGLLSDMTLDRVD
jgi:hypothetical protein